MSEPHLSRNAPAVGVGAFARTTPPTPTTPHHSPRSWGEGGSAPGLAKERAA